MKNLFIYTVGLMFILILSSCSVTDYQNRSTGDTAFICFVDKYTPGFIERYTNQQNMEKIQIGMSKKEVFEIMGEPLLYEKYAYNQPNTWYYYTNWDWADAAKTESESVPIIFKDDKVIGWGLVFFRRYKQKDWLYNPEGVFNKYGLQN